MVVFFHCHVSFSGVCNIFQNVYQFLTGKSKQGVKLLEKRFKQNMGVSKNRKNHPKMDGLKNNGSKPY